MNVQNFTNTAIIARRRPLYLTFLARTRNKHSLRRQNYKCNGNKTCSNITVDYKNDVCNKIFLVFIIPITMPQLGFEWREHHDFIALNAYYMNKSDKGQKE